MNLLFYTINILLVLSAFMIGTKCVILFGIETLIPCIIFSVTWISGICLSRRWVGMVCLVFFMIATIIVTLKLNDVGMHTWGIALAFIAWHFEGLYQRLLKSAAVNDLNILIKRHCLRLLLVAALSAIIYALTARIQFHLTFWYALFCIFIIISALNFIFNKLN